MSGVGFAHRSLNSSQFKEFVDFIFNGNIREVTKKGIIRYGVKNAFDDEIVKASRLDDYVLLSDGVVYFTFEKEKGTFYYAFEEGG